MTGQKKAKSGHSFNRKPSKISQFFYRLSFLVFFSSLVYILFFSPYLLVTAVNVSGTDRLDPNLISDIVSSRISGKYFNILAKNNLILIRKNEIKMLLADKFKKIEKVEIKKTFPSRLDVEIFERRFVLIFESAGSLFLIDEKGKAFREADFRSGGEGAETEGLIKLTDNSGKSVVEGEELIKAEDIDFVLGIKDKLKQEVNLETDENFSVPGLIFPDIRVRTQEGWEIYFNRELDLKKEVDMLKVVLENSIDSVGKRPDLEYVDLRVDNKVFYKLKGGLQEEINKEEDNKQPTEKKSDRKKKK
jgi:cell division septal protein FtsQ